MLDAFQSSIVGRNVPLADVALRDGFRCTSSWALFSVRKRWYCVRIWRNISRAASLTLRRGSCGCFYWTVYCRWCDACIAATALVSSRWDNFVWLPNCCSPLHWGQILDRIQLEGPKKCWRSACTMDLWWHGHAIRSSISRGMIASKALGREKWDFLYFPNFI